MATPRNPTTAVSKRENIQVFVRVRPMNEKERLERKNANVVELKRDREVVVRDRTNSTLTRTFAFDKAFGPTSKQVDVYKSVAQPMIAEVLEGYNCTIFAYGQTGTGKTFTMEGERSDNDTTWEKDPLCGLVPRVLSHMFDELRLKNLEFTMGVSYLELYNEELIDLLSPEEDNSKLRLFEDASQKGSVIVQGLTDVKVLDKKQVYEILSKGSKKRQTAATFMNATSSRSHTIFTVTIHIRESTEAGEDLIRTGKINLVDLAGSENISRSGATNQRAKEAGNINQSLLTLGRVITALVEKTPHVPYRESKLTRLLQDSLGGKTKTAIVATVSPVLANLEETLSTLDYAHRAKSITNRPQINQRLSKQAFIKEYDQEIERLRKDLVAQRAGTGIYVDPENYREMEEKIDRQDGEILEKIQHIRALEDEREKREAFVAELTTKLQDTEEQLERTSANLMVTEKNLEEKEVLLDYHIDTEKNLKVDTEKLIAITDETSGDLKKTHNAIERMKQLEADNKAVVATFQSNMEQHIGVAKCSAEENHTAQEGHLAALEVSAVTLGQAMDDVLADFVAEVGALKASVPIEQLSQLQQTHYSQVEQLERQANLSMQSRIEGTVKMIRRQICERQEQLEQARLGQLQVKLEENSQLVTKNVEFAFMTNIEEVKQREKEYKDQLEAFRTENMNLRLELAAEREKVKKLEATISSNKVDNEQLWQSTSTMLQQFMEKSLQAVSNNSSKSSLGFDQLGQQCKSVSSSCTSNISHCDEIETKFQTSINNNTIKTQESVNTLASKQTETLASLKSQAAEAKQQVVAADAAIERVAASGKKHSDDLEAEVLQVAAEQDVLALARMETLEAQLGAQQTVLQNTEAALAAQEQKAVAEVQAKRLAFEEQLSERKEEAEALARKTQEARDTACRHLENLRQGVDQFVHHELGQYAPSGSTPARQDREYPRNLKFSSPAPRVLARFYAQNNHDSGMNSPDSETSKNSGTSDLENQPAILLDPVDLARKIDQIQADRRILGSRN